MRVMLIIFKFCLNSLITKSLHPPYNVKFEMKDGRRDGKRIGRGFEEKGMLVGEVKGEWGDEVW